MIRIGWMYTWDIDLEMSKRIVRYEVDVMGI